MPQWPVATVHGIGTRKLSSGSCLKPRSSPGHVWSIVAPTRHFVLSCKTATWMKSTGEFWRDFISRRKQAGITDTTIRWDLAFLSSLCAMAVRWGWLDTNPVTALNKRALKASRPRTRFLTATELDQLLAATAGHIRPAIILALETGLRKEELFSLTLSGIDLTRREISSTIPRAAFLAVCRSAIRRSLRSRLYSISRKGRIPPICSQRLTAADLLI